MRIQSAVLSCRRVLAGVAGIAWLVGCGEPEPATSTDRYLEAAVQVGEWLQSVSRNGTGGEAPDEISLDATSGSLGTGAAGRAIFFAELFAATGDTTFQGSSARAAVAAREWAAEEAERVGLYNGLAGVALALTEVALATDDAELRDYAEGIFRSVMAAGDRENPGPAWGGVNDILAGTAGIGVSLLYAADHFDDPSFLDAAVRAGDDLLGVADRTPQGDVRWMRGSEMPLDLPNFSHGTAGVAFFLAQLGKAAGQGRFTAAARAGADYLDRISAQEDGLFLVPYGVPDEGYSTPHDIGWAHGPAGTARLHYELWMQAGDAEMRTRVDQNARTLLASGIPGPSADSTLWVGPFGVDKRFGTSGAAEFLIDWGSAVGNEAYLSAASEIVQDILGRATESERGLYWSLPRYGFQGGEGTAVFTGYFYGAAGLGLTLLRQHYAERGEYPTIRLPDDPFPIRARVVD